MIRGRMGMMYNPGLLALLALGAGGCPDDPEPASTAPPCKDSGCPVDEPASDDPSIAPPPAVPPGEQLRGASVTTVHIDEASHRPAALLDTGRAPLLDPANTDVPPPRVIRTSK